MTRRSRLVAGVVIALAMGLLGGRALQALFTSTATVELDVTVETPVIPPPATVSCVTSGLTPSANFTWTPPAAAPQPTEYVIRVLADGDEIEVRRVAGNVLSASVTVGILSGTLAFLLSLLLGGDDLPVTVNAVYGAYESPSAFAYHLHTQLLGVGCSPGMGSFAFAALALAEAPAATTTSPALAPTSTTSVSTSTTTTPSPTTITTSIASTTAPTSTTTTSTTTTSTTTTSTTSTTSTSTTTTSTAPPAPPPSAP